MANNKSVAHHGAQMLPEHIHRFEEASRSMNPTSELYELAVSLRDEGVPQIEVYLIFESFLIATDAEDPTYDAIADNMDYIHGGAWAKGHDLFPEELTSEVIKRSRKARLAN